MIQLRTILESADNTGAKKLMCIRLHGGYKRRYARIGDIITCSVKEAEPRMAVKKGDVVFPGQPLFEGNPDLKEIFQLCGRDYAQRAIVKEIQKIYVSQGALIHDKHIEIICRQMFSRIKIKESEDSSFSPGEIIEKTKFSQSIAEKYLRQKQQRYKKFQKMI